MRRVPRLSLVLLVSLTLSVYFTHHARNGSHGLQARQKLIARSSMLEYDLGRLESVRAKLQRDLALLATDPPHPDSVAIIAGDVLGYVPSAAFVLRTAPR
jgi:cell division protein FtsB